MFLLILSLLSTFSFASLTVVNNLENEISVLTEGHCNPLEHLHDEKIIEAGNSATYEFSEDNFPICLVIRTHNHHYISDKIEKVKACRVIVTNDEHQQPIIKMGQDCYIAD